MIMSSHNNAVQPHLEQVPPPPPTNSFEEAPSPISAQLFEFCDPDLFTETMQNMEATSTSNCCYEHQYSYTANLCFPSGLDEKLGYKLVDIDKLHTDQTDNANNTTTSSSGTTIISLAIGDPFTLTANSNNLSVIFNYQKEIDDDISASIDFSLSPPFSANPYLTAYQNDKIDYSLQHPVVFDPSSHYPSDIMLPLMGSKLPPVSEEDCLSTISSLHMNPQSASSYSFLDPLMGSFFPGHLNGTTLAGDSCSSFFTGTILGGQELEPKELFYQRENNGIFSPDKIPSTYNSGDAQPLSNETQHIARGAADSALTGTDISIEDSTIKVAKLSPEERKEKIHRYMKKRNERNFTKKIKYACRKTLADSRPRVRGRFAKNDELGESHRHIGAHHEEDNYDEVTVKEEDDMVDSAGIYAHIRNAKSFKCGYPSSIGRFWISE